jgi:5-hydroxyisourate hydrolase
MGISTHILDTALGRPAADVPVSLAHWQSGGWVLLNGTVTDADGRAKHLLPAEKALATGLYRARFNTAAYYEAQGLAGLYPYVDIVFEVKDADQHYHVPLLLTANGYTTYRGS